MDSIPDEKWYTLLEAMTRVATHSDRTNRTMIDSVEKLTNEVRGMRRDMIRTPLVVLILIGFGFLLTQNVIEPWMFLGVFVSIIILPFFPEALPVWKRLLGSQEKSE